MNNITENILIETAKTALQSDIDCGNYHSKFNAKFKTSLLLIQFTITTDTAEIITILQNNMYQIIMFDLNTSNTISQSNIYIEDMLQYYNSYTNNDEMFQWQLKFNHIDIVILNTISTIYKDFVGCNIYSVLLQYYFNTTPITSSINTVIISLYKNCTKLINLNST